ncbi:MAG: A/G-specific adenine glycosylase [Candidatus Omnitrophica bacterium]|nr:A/G-specific adenine glycosylase [Candidatus Omnitrophota bacterium]
MNVHKETVKQIQVRLLRWYKKHKRPLPWRTKKSPYRTFISEVMLQQTQIKTVIPYFERWMKVFPTVEKLAKAPIDRVLKLWEGLGYYTRARNLHRASQIIVEKHGGKIPSDYETLLSLPGIGRYTAGAVASIAFDQPVPLVDGNVARVFSRVFNIHKDILKPETQNELYAIAYQLVPQKNPGEFNQALMELGSLVCFPTMPSCRTCPVSSLCIAQRKGIQESLPIKSNSLKRKKVNLATAIVIHAKKLLIRKRPEKGIWAGLWELPSVAIQNGKKFEEKLSGELKETHGVKLKSTRALSPSLHRLTHLDVTIYPYLFKPASLPSLSPSNGERVRARGKWITKSDVKKFSFPVPYQKLIKHAFEIQKGDRQRSLTCPLFDHDAN